MTLDLSIVVPAFNEAHRMHAGMERFDAAVAEGAIDLRRTEVVVVDDGSTDGTAEAARKLLAALPHHRVLTTPVNRGKGAAVRTGIRAARGACCAYMDADMAIDPRAVPLLLEGLRTHDITIGSRTLADSMVESRYVLRSLMGGLFNRLVTAGTGLALDDTQCGFKAFRTPVARLLFHLVRIDRFAFDVEILSRARSLGMTISEVPVQWKHVPGSTVHPLNDSLSMLWDVYRSRLGLREVPPVPALVVRDASHTLDPDQLTDRVRGALRTALPDTPLPVAVDGTTALVLLPLVPGADTDRAVAAVREGTGGASVTRRTLPFRALAARRPWADRLAPPPAD